MTRYTRLLQLLALPKAALVQIAIKKFGNRSAVRQRILWGYATPDELVEIILAKEFPNQRLYKMPTA